MIWSRKNTCSGAVVLLHFVGTHKAASYMQLLPSCATYSHKVFHASFHLHLSSLLHNKSVKHNGSSSYEDLRWVKAHRGWQDSGHGPIYRTTQITSLLASSRSRAISRISRSGAPFWKRECLGYNAKSNLSREARVDIECRSFEVRRSIGWTKH